MWLCEYCDTENVEENIFCASCEKPKVVCASNKIKEEEYDLCSAALKLKKWGKVLMFACFGISVFYFITAVLLIPWLTEILFRNDDFMRNTMIMSFSSQALNIFITMLMWFGRGILIKLVLDALAIIVQSSHLNIKSKRGE